MVTKTKIKKGTRKKFFEVKMPFTATKVHLYGYSPEDLEGSIVKLDLTRSLKGKNLELRARAKLEENELVGEFVSLQLLQSYIKKVMRRGVNYVEDSFEVECKDAKLSIKPFLITRNKVSRKVRSFIRETAKKHLIAKARIRTSDELFSEIITNKLQKELSLKIKKIYPLGLCEIRMLKVLGKLEKKKDEVKEDKAKTEEEKK